MAITSTGLYRIKEYFWLLYPTKETVLVAAATRSVSAWMASTVGAYWSEQLKCQVGFISENKIIQVIEIDEEYVRILGTEGTGWIWVPSNKEWTDDCFEKVSG